jgi:hypothetical protein
MDHHGCWYHFPLWFRTCSYPSRVRITRINLHLTTGYNAVPAGSSQIISYRAVPRGDDEMQDSMAGTELILLVGIQKASFS